MNRSTLTALAALALAPLAACGQSDTAADNATPVTNAAETAAAEGIDYGTRIRDLPEGQRRGVLFRAIRDSGQDGASCQAVTSMNEAAPTNGLATWNAVCDNTARWAIVFANDGTATVTGPLAAEPARSS